MMILKLIKISNNKKPEFILHLIPLTPLEKQFFLR